MQTLNSSYIEPKNYIDYLFSIGRIDGNKFPKTAILCFQKSLFKHIIDTQKDIQKAHGPRGELYFANNYCIVADFGIGPSVSAMMMEELITLGVKKFISIGTAGTIQSHANIGDLIIVDKAIMEDGVSEHYVKKDEREKMIELSKNTISFLQETFKNSTFTIHKGASWTMSAPYRETFERIKQYQKQNTFTVEMEIAALASVAQFRKVEYGAMLVISDSLTGEKWEPRQQSTIVLDNLKILYDKISQLLI